MGSEAIEYFREIWERDMPGKFVSILQKMGQLFKVGAEKAIALEANPVVQQIESGALTVASIAYPPGSVAFQCILTQIVKVEQIATALNASSGNGAAKLQLVIPEIADLIMSEPLFKGKTPKDMDAFNKGIADIVNGFVEVTNSFEA